METVAREIPALFEELGKEIDEIISAVEQTELTFSSVVAQRTPVVDKAAEEEKEHSCALASHLRFLINKTRRARLDLLDIASRSQL